MRPVRFGSKDVGRNSGILWRRDEANCFQMAGDHRGLVSGKYRRIVWTDAITFMWIKKCVWSQIKPTKTPYRGSVVWKHADQRGLKKHAGTWVDSKVDLKWPWKHSSCLISFTPFLYLHLPLTGAAPSFCDHVAKTLKGLTPKTGSKLSEMPHRMSPSHPGFSRGILVPLSFRAFIILTRILILNSSSSPFYFPRFSFWGWYTTSFPNPLPHDRWLHSF